MLSVLTQLVLDRADVDGTDFKVLLYMSLVADEHDVAYATIDAIRTLMRSRASTIVQRSLHHLRELGYIEKVRPSRSLYLLRRDRLVAGKPRLGRVDRHTMERFFVLSDRHWDGGLVHACTAQTRRTISLVSQVAGIASAAATGFAEPPKRPYPRHSGHFKKKNLETKPG